ncbi:MAG: Lysophospholipid transporter LplT / 2-acylglycerophosphoethanolamine acyltransferase [Pseudomonadota bacterium]
MAHQFALLRQRRFAPFFGAQFLGAFNDNLFKTALVTVITFDALHWTTISAGLLNNLIAGLFILPFLLLSATAGQIADKFDKTTVMRIVKLMEILIMGVAAIGWYTHSLWLLVAAVVGMGVHSTLFGPVKHAYLPQHLEQSELIGGNGMVQMGTFVGILTGQLSGAAMVALASDADFHLLAGACLAVAVIGWLFTLAVPLSAAADPSLVVARNPFAEMMRNLQFSARNREVFIAMLANSWFWFYGAMLLAQFPVFARDVLHGAPEIFAILLTAFSLGIGAGSLWCECLSGRQIHLGLVPLGALGLTLFGIDLYWASTASMPSLLIAKHLISGTQFRVLADCFLLGLSGGIYVVPLFALIQTRAERSHLSRTIGGMNILNALFMVIAALTAMVLLGAGLSVPEIFLCTALLNLAMLLLLCLMQREYPRALLSWLEGLWRRRSLVE